MSYLVVIPAYRRDYRSKKEVLAEWEEGKDFEIVDASHRGGRYINKADKPAGLTLQVRYARQTKVMLIT